MQNQFERVILSKLRGESNLQFDLGELICHCGFMKQKCLLLFFLLFCVSHAWSLDISILPVSLRCSPTQDAIVTKQFDAAKLDTLKKVAASLAKSPTSSTLVNQFA